MTEEEDWLRPRAVPIHRRDCKGDGEESLPSLISNLVSPAGDKTAFQSRSMQHVSGAPHSLLEGSLKPSQFDARVIEFNPVTVPKVNVESRHGALPKDVHERSLPGEDPQSSL